MGDHRNHWPPREGDPVTVSRREDAGMNPDGFICYTDEDCDEITVQFYGDDIKWQGDRIKHPRINGILYNSIIVLMVPEMLLPTGTSEQSFTYDDFHHRWSSHSGGKGRWIILD